VVCRYSQDEKGAFSFYYFVIAGNQDASIWKVVDSEPHELTVRLKFDEINAGSDSNRITAECLGRQLTFWINNLEILVISDTTLPSGDVGVIAATYDDGGLDVRFDNFVVVLP